MPNHGCPEAKGSNTTTGLSALCSVLGTHAGEILTTGTTHKKKPDGFFPKEPKGRRTSKCVRPEGGNKWPNSMTAR